MKHWSKAIIFTILFVLSTSSISALSEYYLLYGTADDGSGSDTIRAASSRSSILSASFRAATSLEGEFGRTYDQFWTRAEEIRWRFQLKSPGRVTIRAIQLQDGDDNYEQLNEVALIRTPCGNYTFDDGVVAVRTRTKEFSCDLKPGTHFIFSIFAGEKVGTEPTVYTSGSYKITMEYEGPVEITPSPTPNPTRMPTATPPPVPTSTPRPTSTPTPTQTPTPTPTPTPVPARVQASVRQNSTATCDYSASDPGTTVKYHLRNASCGYDSGVVTATNGNRTFNNLTCFGSSYRLTTEYVDTTHIFRCDGRNNNIVESVFSVSPAENKQIFKVVSALREPWIQVVGGDAYARDNIAYDIPGSADGGAFFVRSSAGMALAGNSLNVGVDGVRSANFASESGQRDESYAIATSNFSELRDRFLSNVDSSAYTGTTPTVQDLDGNGITILYSANTITLSGDWTGINDSYIIYSDDSIVIPNSLTNDAEERISLGNDGFLLMYAKNDFIVDQEIGTQDDNSSETIQLEGMFMAGRNFILNGTDDRNVDERINIYGAVITGIETTAGTLVSYRSHEDNYLYPAVKLTFNPKLLLNAPVKVISVPTSQWLEIE